MLDMYIEKNLGGKYIINTSPGGIRLDGQKGVRKLDEHRFQITLAKLKISCDVWSSEQQYKANRKSHGN